MSDLAPLVLSVIKDKTVLDLKEENEKLAAQVNQLERVRDNVLSCAIEYGGRIEITDSKNKQVYAEGFLKGKQNRRGPSFGVSLANVEELKGGINAAQDIEIRLNGVVLTKYKPPRLYDKWLDGCDDMREIKQFLFSFRPDEHNVKPWDSLELCLYAEEKSDSNNDRRLRFTLVNSLMYRTLMSVKKI